MSKKSSHPLMANPCSDWKQHQLTLEFRLPTVLIVIKIKIMMIDIIFILYGNDTSRIMLIAITFIRFIIFMYPIMKPRVVH